MTKVRMRLTLLGADGELVQLPGPNGQQQTIEVTTEFELGRPPGVAPSTSLPFALAINVNQVPLPRNQRFEWRLDIDGRTEPDWHVSFQTLDPMPPAFGPRLGN
ncbi:hypothetical protein [Intrasporangium calvum]|uniref:hypothetical protein n=1 Tax=Intrasporangium calvum TaxID=53358 RepID=UPI0012375D46|nr:hypothetical protein [Intrasporangium calvum]